MTTDTPPDNARAQEYDDEAGKFDKRRPTGRIIFRVTGPPIQPFPEVVECKEWANGTTVTIKKSTARGHAGIDGNAFCRECGVMGCISKPDPKTAAAGAKRAGDKCPGRMRLERKQKVRVRARHGSREWVGTVATGVTVLNDSTTRRTGTTARNPARGDPRGAVGARALRGLAGRGGKRADRSGRQSHIPTKRPGVRAQPVPDVGGQRPRRGGKADRPVLPSELSPPATAARAAECVTHCFTLSDPTLAWLIVNGKKTLENRTFRFGVGWYAVHVGKGAKVDVDAARGLRSEYPEMPEPATLPRGCVYGVCKIEGAKAAGAACGDRWYVAPYPWANIISDAIRFDVPAGRAMGGNLGVVPLGRWEGEVRAAARRAVAMRGDGGSPAEPCSGLCRRPQEQDVLLGCNEWAYASYAQLNGRWMGALFARQDIPAGGVIAEYRGPIMTEAHAREEPVDGNQYMLTARRIRDGRMVTIDGTPTVGRGNLAGYANYASDGAANARLSDEAGAPPPGHVGPTYVVIRAEVAVPAGTEVRIDYDLAQRYAARGTGAAAVYGRHASAPTAVPGAADAARGDDGSDE